MNLEKFNAPVNVMKHGLQSSQQAKMMPHPVQMIEARSHNEEMLHVDFVRKTYGIQMAMTLAVEKDIFSRPHRLPGLPSSTIHSDILSGKDTKIDFSDYLNDPQVRPEAPRVTLHEIMEAKHGIL
jgi:hypothetical protein